MYTSPHPRPWPAPRPSSSGSSRQKRGVGSSAFLCSCSKSGGGSRGGQAVKLAGRNHDMKRRCGIATSWRPALDTNCADHPRREIRFQVGTLTGWEGCTEAGCRDGSRRRGTWRRRLLLDGKAAPRRKRPDVRCICVASLMYAQKTVCRCTFLTLNSAGCGRGLVGCLKPCCEWIVFLPLSNSFLPRLLLLRIDFFLDISIGNPLCWRVCDSQCPMKCQYTELVYF